MNRLLRCLPLVLIALFLGALYFRTLAPGLTWANDGADGGDLVTAVVTGGVPHPGGYPTYLVLASVFSKLPFESPAYGTNLLSLACALLAAVLMYAIQRKAGGGVVPACLAALAFGSFPLVWSQAVITEVNAVAALFAALVVYWLGVRAPTPREGLAGGLAAGLGLGAHLTLAFLLPLLFLGTMRQGWRAYVKPLALRLAGFALGLGVYGLIPLRARAQAPVNWGNAVDLPGFLWLVSGRMYHDRLERFNWAYLEAGFRAWSRALLEQLGPAGLALVFLALAFGFKPTRLYLVSLWMFLVYSLFSIIYYSPDSYVYLLPPLMSVALWVGEAAAWLLERIAWRPRFSRPLTVGLLLSIFVLRALAALPSMDLSSDHAAEDYARSVLEAAPPRAILLADGDEAVFSLWYVHYALHARPDLVVLARGLMPMPWYRQTLRATYPDLTVPDLPWAEAVLLVNASRPACELGVELRPQLQCSRGAE